MTWTSSRYCRERKIKCLKETCKPRRTALQSPSRKSRMGRRTVEKDGKGRAKGRPNRKIRSALFHSEPAVCMMQADSISQINMFDEIYNSYPGMARQLIAENQRFVDDLPHDYREFL